MIGFNLIVLLIVIAACILIYSIYLYNTIVSAKNKVDETLSAIDVMLKNRFDMIPNLVATVKEYMNHETKLLNDLTEKRTAVINGTTQEKVDVDNMFTSAFRTIFANAEAYPDLKSSANFISLQKEISSIENKLQATRRTYNAAVKRIHDLKLQVPTNMLAGSITLTDYPYFEATEAEQGDINVTELFDNK